MMNKIATAAAALSLIVGASPAFAFFPDYPIDHQSYRNVTAESVEAFDTEDVNKDDAATLDMGWEALGVLPPTSLDDEFSFDFHDGLTYPGDVYEDQSAAVESETDMPI